MLAVAACCLLWGSSSNALSSQRQVSTLPAPQANADMEAKARRYFSLGNRVKQQLGPTNAADLEAELADDFEFVAPLVGPLDRKAIIAAATGLDLQQALPDFDARYHDFRADAVDPCKVWCTMRVTATQTGVLRFGGVTAEPKNPPTVVESPPEAVSLRFDPVSGRLRELTTGYPLDRRVGTTRGLGGLFGILEGVGCPLPTPLTRPTGAVLAPLLRPFGLALPTASEDDATPRPTVDEDERLDDGTLLELAARLLESDFGAENGTASSLLADRFEFCGPVVGPLRKAAFLSSPWCPSGLPIGLSEGLPDLAMNYRDAVVCEFDVNRVWYTSAPTGTHAGPLRLSVGGGGDKEYPPTGKRWESPPERGSLTFDGKGRCVHATGGYTMDRRLGNTGGLGGVFGLCAALGIPPPSPAFLLRTPVQNWARLWAKK
mmetsp:Transcript_47217/g.95145  ORF Transcript_47217/g.95145 Transcript_47217/m.95145 type:complete len:432 (+) Transcript_47217:120-1415(+)